MRCLHYSAVCPLVTYLRLLVDKELALFVVKFVLEGLINASPKGSLTENIALQVRTYGILVGTCLSLLTMPAAAPLYLLAIRGPSGSV